MFYGGSAVAAVGMSVFYGGLAVAAVESVPGRAKTSRSTEAVILKVTEGASRAGDLDQFDAVPVMRRRPQNAKVTRVAHSPVTLHL